MSHDEGDTGGTSSIQGSGGSSNTNMVISEDISRLRFKVSGGHVEDRYLGSSHTRSLTCHLYTHVPVHGHVLGEYVVT